MSTDSLNLKKYKDLKTHIKASKNDSIKKKHIEAYLSKAKAEQNIVEIAEGYKYFSLLTYPDSIASSYADSIIAITKKLHNIKYPALGYNIKGGIYFEMGKYKKALDLYLMALDHAKKNKNHFQYLTIKFNIGLIKNHLNERQEAQKIYKEYLRFIEETNGKYPKNYIKGLYAIADSYIYSKKYDSANIYIKKGIYKSLKRKDSSHYSSLVLASGVNNYFQAKYAKAIDSLKKAKLFLLRDNYESTRASVCDYYIGRSLNDLNRIDESIHYFKKVDSTLSKTLNVTPELIDAYTYLIADAKQNGNLKNQIKYVNSLIRFDSVLDVNYKYIKNTLIKKYDISERILEKEKLINKLNQEKNNSDLKAVFMIVTIILLLALSAYVIYKNRLNKKRYNVLKKEIENKNTISNESIQNDTSTNITSDNIGIPENLINSILMELDKFEKSTNYISKKYTLNSLAKELKTNSSYLSKVINETKQVNYLNNLKIDYAIKKISSDKKFRAYTIKAIAIDSGFNNAQSFSVAFNKKTGIYPSYFIKKINSEREKTNS